MVKAGLLSAKNPHATGHLRTLQLLPEVESIYVFDQDEAALAALQKAQGDKVAEVYTDLDALLAREDVSFVVAPLKGDRCVEICLRALAAGKHILCEKPIGRGAHETEQVVLAAEQARLQVGVAYTNRYHPLNQRARALIAQGVIGPLVSVEMRMITTQVGIRNPKDWLFSKARAGGGILVWLGCHYVDMMRFVTGDEIVSVAAQVSTRSGEDIDVEDVATLSVRFRSGAVGSLHAGYVMAFPNWGANKMPSNDIYEAFNGRCGRIYWHCTDLPPRLHVESTLDGWKGAPIWEFEPSVAESPAYGNVYGEAFMRDFIRATQGEGQVPASGRDALQVARIIDAAYESSRTGRRVDIEYPA
jgi:predicted dehydrogenase